MKRYADKLPLLLNYFLHLSGKLITMRYSGMTIEGALASVVYLIFFYILGWIIVKNRYANPRLHRLFMQGLTLKFVGALGFALIYQFYYGGGDTFRYFANATTLVDFFSEHPGQYFDFLLESWLTRVQIARLDGVTNMMFEDSTYIVVRLASFIGLFTGHYYLVTTFFFAFLSYIGVWALYRTACRLFPQYYLLIAIPILFIPSFFFWGSSIMKDSIVVGFLGLLVYLSYRVLLLKELRLHFLLLLAVCFYVLFNVKVYVILSFLPALFLWLVFEHANRIPNPQVRALARPLSIAAMVVFVLVGLPLASSYSHKYDVENVLETAETTANYIYRTSLRKGGSAYSLGDVNYTPLGMIRAFPKAVNVTLFRPYLWEVSNPVMLLAALEGTAFLAISLFLLFKIGVLNVIRFTLDNPFLFASLVFSIIFAFAVGFSTYNFGSLVRYKIPCLPFYGLVLAVTYGEYKARQGGG